MKSGSSSPAPATLREAVIAYFDAELSRYQSRVQVDFGRRAGAALELGGPEFDFEVRRRTGRPLGLIDIEVAIQRADETVQKVQLQPIVSLSRRVVVARRAINLQASIRPEDVQVVEMTFNRLDRLGVTDPDQVIGQRARQFIAAGTMLKLRDLESVPLVKRGQLVDVVSRAGGIVVVTTAKAMGSGALGELVELRGQDRGSQRLVGVVTGPRRVELRGEALAAADRDRGRLTRAGGRR